MACWAQLHFAASGYLKLADRRLTEAHRSFKEKLAAQKSEQETATSTSYCKCTETASVTGSFVVFFGSQNSPVVCSGFVIINWKDPASHTDYIWILIPAASVQHCLLECFIASTRTDQIAVFILKSSRECFVANRKNKVWIAIPAAQNKTVEHAVFQKQSAGKWYSTDAVSRKYDQCVLSLQKWEATFQKVAVCRAVTQSKQFNGFVAFQEFTPANKQSPRSPFLETSSHLKHKKLLSGPCRDVTDVQSIFFQLGPAPQVRWSQNEAKGLWFGRQQETKLRFAWLCCCVPPYQSVPEPTGVYYVNFCHCSFGR